MNIFEKDADCTDCRIHRYVRQTSFVWGETVETLLQHIQTHYTLAQHGLDLSKSSFLKSEVYRADECLTFYKHGRLKGFVFLITHKRPRALYVTLMASFQCGMGRYIMNYLDDSFAYSHEYLALRATVNSVGFYLKLGFYIFDFSTLHDYVNGSYDCVLTLQICEAAEKLNTLRHETYDDRKEIKLKKELKKGIKNELKEKKRELIQFLQTLQTCIVKRKWIPEGCDEFPLLKKRRCAHQMHDGSRQSSRLSRLGTKLL